MYLSEYDGSTLGELALFRSLRRRLKKLVKPALHIGAAYLTGGASLALSAQILARKNAQRAQAAAEAAANAAQSGATGSAPLIQMPGGDDDYMRQAMANQTRNDVVRRRVEEHNAALLRGTSPSYSVGAENSSPNGRMTILPYPMSTAPAAPAPDSYATVATPADLVRRMPSESPQSYPTRFPIYPSFPSTQADARRAEPADYGNPQPAAYPTQADARRAEPADYGNSSASGQLPSWVIPGGIAAAVLLLTTMANRRN